MKIYALNGYIFVEARGFQHYALYNVKIKNRKIVKKIRHIDENRSEHDATVELTIGRVIWFFVCFPKEKKKKQSIGECCNS